MSEEKSNELHPHCDALINEIAAILAHWESTNENKPEYFRASVLMGTLMSLLCAVCITYRVPLTVDILQELKTLLISWRQLWHDRDQKEQDHELH